MSSHTAAHAAVGTGPDAGTELPPATGGISATRRWAGLALAGVGLPVLTAVLVGVHDQIALDSVLLLYLLCVVVIAVIGGVLPAVVAAVASFLLANFFLTPPFHTFVVARRDEVIALLVFVVAAVVVSLTVDAGARNRAAAERSRMEAHLISTVTTGDESGRTVEAVLEQVRSLFAMTSVSLVRDEGGTSRRVATAGPLTDEAPTLTVPAGAELTLVAQGPELFAEDRQLLSVLAASAARAWQERRLGEQAARAEQLAETDRVRSALLAAVSHDLRTPLAGIKASVSGLRQRDISWTAEQQQDLLATIEDCADRLDELISNLLAMSRLQAGALSVQLSPVALDEVVARALLDTAPAACIDIPDDLPLVLADAGLLERVVANLVDNACRFSLSDGAVQVRAHTGTGGASVLLDVVDHGPGVAPEHRDEMFLPFQRLGDHDAATGVGLGLAIARGFTEAMGGTITPSTTSGGGLTMTVGLPTAS
jgi:two-component system, OmpR family, sensor histidine kinase KdpD